MSKISYTQARAMLSQACARYVYHKKMQLDGLVGVSPYLPEDIFFLQALDKDEPSPGFNDWIRCDYYSILDYMFRISHNHNLQQYKNNSVWIKTENGEYQRFPQLKFYRRQDENLDQYEPDLVLYNFTLLIQMVEHIMNGNESNWISLKADNNYQEGYYAYSEDAPVSLKINKTLQQFRALISIIASLPDYKADMSWLDRRLNETVPSFTSYLKEITVQELSDILNDGSLSDKEAVERIELQLKRHSTLALLKQNNQSPSEQRLKLFSVIAILIGVGIFTTLALVAKRLYDSGGSSINFFKPLSINLCEDIESIAESTKPSV